jgi:hypothetical protein
MAVVWQQSYGPPGTDGSNWWQDLTGELQYRLEMKLQGNVMHWVDLEEHYVRCTYTNWLQNIPINVKYDLVSMTLLNTESGLIRKLRRLHFCCY